MADIVSTEAAVAVVFPLKAEIHTCLAGAAITAGELVYLDSNGVAQLADGSAAGTAYPYGLALQSAGIGQAFNVLKRGHVAGFTITQAYWAQVFVSDTAGAIADAAGTVDVSIGRVVPMTDKALTKVLFIDIDYDLP